MRTHALAVSLPIPPRAAATARARQRWFAAALEQRTDAVISTLYRQHRDEVEAFLVRRGVPPADAPDVCQEVFLVARRRLPSFEGSSSARVWVLGIARKLAADDRRSARRRTEVPLEGVPAGQTVGGCEWLAERDELRRVEAALRKLSPGARDLLLQNGVSGTPVRVLAARQKIPLQTAYSRLHAARVALRREVGDTR